MLHQVEIKWPRTILCKGSKAIIGSQQQARLRLEKVSHSRETSLPGLKLLYLGGDKISMLYSYYLS
eukprot:scaffold284083_cov25-Prasinocladus_malaysianus.AAC.1